jgi:hypothetical protein
VPSSGNVGAAEAVDQTFLNIFGAQRVNLGFTGIRGGLGLMGFVDCVDTPS